MSDIRWHPQSVGRDERSNRAGHRGATIWLTGLSGSGKSTVANEAAHILFDAGADVYVLDGDNLRHGLNSDLGFSDDDRAENVRRFGEVALTLADAGLVVLAPVISPFASGRNAVRRRHHDAGVPFAEVFVATPVGECADRDPKGLYAKQKSGELTGLTGVDAPYEAPDSPELVLVTSNRSVNDCAEELVSALSHLWKTPS
ncbi:MAG: adenylyl-sulfate kinase [Ilumatobacteraceae bacterium]|nr:adenylyl-sulfate kinase [Ilumatobacteraceae bacterium]